MKPCKDKNDPQYTIKGITMCELCWVGFKSILIDKKLEEQGKSSEYTNWLNSLPEYEQEKYKAMFGEN